MKVKCTEKLPEMFASRFVWATLPDQSGHAHSAQSASMNATAHTYNASAPQVFPYGYEHTQTGSPLIILIIGGVARLLLFICCGLFVRQRMLPEQSEMRRSALCSAIATLPTRKAANEVHECSICLCPAVEGEELTTMPCQHEFHTTCINEWLVRTADGTPASCPLCKCPAFEPQLSTEDQVYPHGSLTRYMIMR